MPAMVVVCRVFFYLGVDSNGGLTMRENPLYEPQNCRNENWHGGFFSSVKKQSKERRAHALTVLRFLAEAGQSVPKLWEGAFARGRKGWGAV
jgi:hypothetical protein